MSPEEWAQVQQHFHALCDLPQADRERALARLSLKPQVRQQLEQLLEADNTSELDDLVGKVDRLANQLHDNHRIGATLGDYRLIRLLGEGGMGEVYLAERCDGRFEAMVAVKFLAASNPQSQRLFDRERQVLARLNHPDIARLIDAGEDPRFGAYLVMEYVEGQGLDQYVHRNNASPMDCIRWIIRAARAVAYAHQNLVLHRDLKPDHLMVSESGQLKVLDFGIASLIEQPGTDTQQTVARFSLLFAAPEQLLNQPATTATDVYALGLILYQLISGGDNPFGRDPNRVVERKLAGEADRLLPITGMPTRQYRDLCLIIEKATARCAERRYASPTDLAADLDRVCLDQPISLRDPSLIEAGWRWARQHRVAGFALGVALIALVASAGISTMFAHRAQIQRDAALLEARKSDAIATFLASLFETASPGPNSGPDMPARALLEQGRERIATELSDQPEIAAALEIAMARSYLNLGMYDDALALVEPDRPELSSQQAADRRLLVARLDTLLGEYRRALQRLDGPGITGLTGNALAQANITRATAYVNVGESSQAERAARAAIEAADQSPEGMQKQLSAQNLLGAVAFGRGDYVSAQGIFSEIYRLSRLHYGENSDRAGMALNNLGGVAFKSGDLEAASSAYQGAIDIYQQFFGVDNRAMAMALRSLGLTYRRMGRADESEQTLRRAVAAFENWNGRDNLPFQEASVQLIELLLLLGRDHEARQLLDALPAIDIGGKVDNHSAICRIGLLRQTLAQKALPETSLPPATSSEGTLSQAPPSEPDCLQQRSVADYVIAFDLYLKARQSRTLNQPDSTQAIQLARQHTERLVPPDPMLLEAIARLE